MVAQFANIYPLPAPGVPPFGAGFAPARNEQEREMYAAIGQESGAMWNAHLAPLNAARAEHGLAPLEGVWEQLDHAHRVLVLSSSDFDFPGQLPDNVRYVGARLDDPAWAEDWAPPAGDEPLVLASLSTATRNSSPSCAGSSTRWAACPCAAWSRPATPSRRRSCRRPPT